MAAFMLPFLAYAAGDTLPRLASPLDIPLVLSGNFGELRSNHFHSGLDFKTQGRTGLPVLSADDGYVSRVSVSPWGFGRAVYVTHPSTGLTTVYGHLEAFAPAIDKLVRDEQYTRETFSIDLNFEPGQLPVKRGERIGLSGNSGSSGGPHLHMDVRDTATGHTLDPMPYYKDRVADKVAPDVRSLALYPVAGEGVVDGGSSAVTHAPDKFGVPFVAWGEVIPAIKAYDRMTGTTNIYGVKYLTLSVDGKQIYSRTIDRYDFADTRAINTLVDYAGVAKSGSWMMWTRIADSDPLADMVSAERQGILNIDEERDYRCEWTLTDEHGNSRRVPFVIRGRRSDIPEFTPAGDRLDYAGRNTINVDGAKVYFPPATFYDDVNVAVSTVPGKLSPVVTVGEETIPVSGEYTLDIEVNADSVTDTSKLIMVRRRGKRLTRVDAVYENGHVIGKPSALGTFLVMADNTPPVITPLRAATWGKRGKIEFTVSDGLSGVSSWRGTVDGKWVLFELDGKTGRLSYVMDKSRDTRGKSHKVELTLTDAAGNEAHYSGTMLW